MEGVGEPPVEIIYRFKRTQSSMHKMLTGCAHLTVNLPASKF